MYGNCKNGCEVLAELGLEYLRKLVSVQVHATPFLPHAVGNVRDKDAPLVVEQVDLLRSRLTLDVIDRRCHLCLFVLGMHEVERASQ